MCSQSAISPEISAAGRGIEVDCREDEDTIALNLKGRQQVQFKRCGSEWGFEGFFVETRPGYFKHALRTRHQLSFVSGQFYGSRAATADIERGADSITVTFAGECAAPVPHSLRVRFTATTNCPFVQRVIELVPHVDLDLATGDLAFSLVRCQQGYLEERLITGNSPRVAETQPAPRWPRESIITAFGKETSLDLSDMMGLPAIVAKSRGMAPFCLVYLKELPPNDPIRHFVARESMNEDEIGAVSTRCHVPAETSILETSYWNLFYAPDAQLEDLIPLATGSYWDMVEPFPEEKLDTPSQWMKISENVVRDLFRPQAFGREPVADDDPLKGWTVYTVEEHKSSGPGSPAVALQYWGDYVFRFSRLKGQELLREKLDPMLEKSLRFLRRDEPWSRSFWRTWDAPCLSFFDVERMRCCLPIAVHWDDRELLDLFRKRMEPFIAAGEGFLDGWREDARRREREHAGVDAAYYDYFPGVGWAYAAAGVFALASEIAYYGETLQEQIRETVVAMVRRLNRAVRFADMWHYIPHNIGLLPLGWSVYANVRACEFSGDEAFLDAAWQRMHWVLSMGQFREIPDNRGSCRPVDRSSVTSTEFRWRRDNPYVESVGWFAAGSHERWHAPSEMWQMAPLLAPLLELRPDATALRFLAFARKNMVKVFPARCQEDPDEPLWIPFEFPLSRKDREQYGTGPFFQAAMVFEGFANPDNPTILAFSPTTLYGGKPARHPRVVFYNPTSSPQEFAPGFKNCGNVTLCFDAEARPAPYRGERLSLGAGQVMVAELSESSGPDVGSVTS